MNYEQVKHYVQRNGSDSITWENNPPAASHMGGIWESQIWAAGTILDALLKTHSCSLNDEDSRTLLADTEGIINSRLLTVVTISDVNSQIPFSPSNLQTQKTSVVSPPPGNFDRPDLYSQSRWRRIQHIAGEYWSRWRNEFLQSLRIRQKIEYKKTRLWSWWHSVAEGRPRQEQVANGKSCENRTWFEWCST